MATIGLDKLYYASISEDPTSGEETYAVPKPLAKAISAELSVELDINPTFSHCSFVFCHDRVSAQQSFLSYLYSPTCSRLIRGHYQEGYTHHYKRLS